MGSGAVVAADGRGGLRIPGGNPGVGLLGGERQFCGGWVAGLTKQGDSFSDAEFALAQNFFSGHQYMAGAVHPMLKQSKTAIRNSFIQILEFVEQSK